jgi:anthranilate phosphoribosyltransferase
MLSIWQGRQTDDFGEASIIGTAAVALKLLGKADSQAEAQEMAASLWQTRNRTKFA